MSHTFSIDKGVLGSDRNFSFDGKAFSWADEHPPDAPVLRHTGNPSDPRCLNTLFRLNGVEVSTQLPEAQVAAWKSVLRSDYDHETIRWQHVLQPAVYRQFLTGLVRNVQQGLDRVSTDYYTRVFSRVTCLLERLEHASIDAQKLERYVQAEQSHSNIAVLNSFRPIAGSLARKPTYDRFGSRTGRLTVQAGPEILTLKREYRDIIVSGYPGGKVFYADFSALEARTFLTVVGRDVLTEDVYTELANTFLHGKYPRNVVKLCVLALLFGSGTDPIQRLLKVTKAETLVFVDRLKHHFCVDELRSRLYKEWTENGRKIRNFYGRAVDVPDEQTLINSYIQSTGVDVAMLGFLNIVEDIQRRQLKVSPLFVLHDALLFDVHPQHFGELDTVLKPGFTIPQMKNQFFLHIDPLKVEQATEDTVLSGSGEES